ncbi:MAG: class I SAM-dependent methyltransferase [Chitinophagaceae bacterium]
MDFSIRSYKKELLDGENIPFADILQNMRELDFINTYLGGHAITIEGFKQILQDRKKISICEIGCGGGDNLLAIYKWCKKNKVSVQLTGIDYNKDCIAIAVTRLPASQSQLITADYKETCFGNHTPDIIFSSLFCHHFTHEELLFMLRWMHKNARVGFFINDLHRHFLAFYSIKILTRLFSKSYLVKNDAPLSVKRGFIKKEWIDLLEQSGVWPYAITWKWAFRWLITSQHAQSKLLL